MCKAWPCSSGFSAEAPASRSQKKPLSQPKPHAQLAKGSCPVLLAKLLVARAVVWQRLWMSVLGFEKGGRRGKQEEQQSKEGPRQSMGGRDNNRGEAA